jgi:glycerol-3-phosphate acyltransferase PlsY
VAEFRGGKGVATGLGSFVLIAPKAVLIAAGDFHHCRGFLFALRHRWVRFSAVAALPLLALALHDYAGHSALTLLALMIR